MVTKMAGTKPTTDTKFTSGTKLTRGAKDVLFAPLYVYQGRKVKRDTPRLPEPTGARSGVVDLTPCKAAAGTHKTLNLMIVGDSAAAGVGCQNQTDALAGQLIPALQQQLRTQPVEASGFSALNWSLQATTGHTSFDILRRLYVLPPMPAAIDVMVLNVGVNDTTANVSITQWQTQLTDIIAIAKRKFGARRIIFLSVPPMDAMPALPAPLNSFIGAKAERLDAALQELCAQQPDVHYMAADVVQMADAHHHKSGAPLESAMMFATDGFHPSPLTYGYWAQQLAAFIAGLLTPLK